MVRREEEQRVGTERGATVQVRLRKQAVADQETGTVPVERREVVLEHEPVNEGEVGGGSARTPAPR